MPPALADHNKIRDAAPSSLRICIYGCGAIGSLLAARLAASGAEVSAVARGAQLAAIRSRGLRLLPTSADVPLQVQLKASASPAELGLQDVVILSMKAHAVAAVAADIGPLLGPDTVVLTASNGIPWWYFFGLENDLGLPELASVDPGRRLWTAIGPERALGCVVYPAASIDAPGVVRHVFGNRFSLGEPNGSSSPRLTAVADILRRADFDAPMQTDIRADIWTKLVASAAFNPVSVITGKTLGAMIDDAATCALLERIMTEVITVATALGVTVRLTPQQLLVAIRSLGDHKTSMLQDMQAGRSLELAPVAGAVLELADLAGAAAPNLAMVCRLVASKVG